MLREKLIIQLDFRYVTKVSYELYVLDFTLNPSLIIVLQGAQDFSGKE